MLHKKIPPLPLTAITGFLMYAVAKYEVTPNYNFIYSNIIGQLIFWTGVLICASGVIKFTKSKTTLNPINTDLSTSLVTQGIFRYTRNPMYLGFLFMLLGWGAVLGNVLSNLISILFLPYMNIFQIQHEEKSMLNIFGEEYNKYKSTVRRWL